MTGDLYHVIPIGKWIHDDNQRPLYYTQDATYNCGFHIFLKKEDADLYASSSLFYTHEMVVQVCYKNVVAKGIQHIADNRYKVIVCKDIIIPEVSAEIP